MLPPDLGYLRRPVPLGVPLAVERGARVRLNHGGTVVAEVRAGDRLVTLHSHSD